MLDSAPMLSPPELTPLDKKADFLRVEARERGPRALDVGTCVVMQGRARVRGASGHQGTQKKMKALKISGLRGELNDECMHRIAVEMVAHRQPPCDVFLHRRASRKLISLGRVQISLQSLYSLSLIGDNIKLPLAIPLSSIFGLDTAPVVMAGQPWCKRRARVA